MRRTQVSISSPLLPSPPLPSRDFRARTLPDLAPFRQPDYFSRIIRGIMACVILWIHGVQMLSSAALKAFCACRDLGAETRAISGRNNLFVLVAIGSRNSGYFGEEGGVDFQRNGGRVNRRSVSPPRRNVPQGQLAGYGFLISFGNRSGASFLQLSPTPLQLPNAPVLWNHLSSI